MNVATLDIHDYDERYAPKPSNAGTLSHVGLKLPRWGHIPAALGVHRHTPTRVFHGSGKQPSYFVL